MEIPGIQTVPFQNFRASHVLVQVQCIIIGSSTSTSTIRRDTNIIDPLNVAIRTSTWPSHTDRIYNPREGYLRNDRSRPQCCNFPNKAARASSPRRRCQECANTSSHSQVLSQVCIESGTGPVSGSVTCMGWRTGSDVAQTSLGNGPPRRSTRNRGEKSAIREVERNVCSHRTVSCRYISRSSSSVICR